jgi:hypothetical protein
MTASTTTQVARITPGSAVSVSCGCGGVGCPVCHSELFVRPRFFAGQLLTEDDLTSLGDYVVTKNRLHSRYLFGSGVVCGLTVSCEPCGGGKIIVNPGYALDCCGNDIVVSCPQTLDVNVMVRELLLKLRGADCGDPCADTGASRPPAGAPAQPSRTTAAAGARQREGWVLSPARRYCLYIDYCEELSDPVAPYATGDPCGQATCEPTRVREGFRFELRCPPDEDCVPEICRRLWNCMGDPVAAEKTYVDAEFLRSYGARLRRATSAIRENPAPPVANDYWDQLTARRTALREAAGRVRESPTDEAEEGGRLRLLLRAILALAAGLARFWVQAEPRAESHQQDLEHAAEELREACQLVTPDRIERAMTAALMRVHAQALVEAAHHLAEETIRRYRERGEREVTTIRDMITRYLAEEAVFNHRITGAVASSLSVLRDWLIVQLDRQQIRTRCGLPKEVSATPLPPPSAEADQATADTVGRAAEILCRSVRQILRDCFCNALNPPCPSCDDPAVLLACLVVEDCEVTEICNLERDFVITGPAIRYWVPELTRRGEVLERWCCPSHREECAEPEDDERDEYDDWDRSIRSVFGPAPVDVEQVLSFILEGCRPPRKDGRPQRELLEFVSRRLPERAAEPTADAASIGEIVNRVTAELRDEIGRLRGEIEGLHAENVQLEERIASAERSGRRPRGGGDAS